MFRLSKILHSSLISLVLLFAFANCGYRTIMVHDPFVDIVLIFDQSGSMHEKDFKHIYQGFREWVFEYYNYHYVKELVDISETRFAVIGCFDNKNKSKIEHYLQDTKDANGVIKAISNIDTKYDSQDYFDTCFDTVREDILSVNKGERPKAPNVVILVTDCDFNIQKQFGPIMATFILPLAEYTSGYLRDAVTKTNGYFGIACLMKNKGGVWDYYDSTDFEKTTWIWASKSWTNIINFTNVQDLRKRMDEVLPKKAYITRDCEEKDEWTECKPNLQKGAGICEKSKPIIIVQPYNDSYAYRCSPTITQQCPCLGPVTTKPTTTTTTPTTTTTKTTTTTTKTTTTTTKATTTTTKPTTTTTKTTTTTTKPTTTTTTTKPVTTTTKPIIATTTTTRKPPPTTTTKKPQVTPKRPPVTNKEHHSTPKEEVLLPETEIQPTSLNTEDEKTPIDPGKRVTPAKEEDSNVAMYIGIAVAGAILLSLLLLIILLVVLRRKRKKGKTNKRGKTKGLLERGRKEKSEEFQVGLETQTKTEAQKKQKLGNKGVTNLNREKTKQVHASMETHQTEPGAHKKPMLKKTAHKGLKEKGHEKTKEVHASVETHQTEANAHKKPMLKKAAHKGLKEKGHEKMKEFHASVETHQTEPGAHKKPMLKKTAHKGLKEKGHEKKKEVHASVETHQTEPGAHKKPKVKKIAHKGLKEKGHDKMKEIKASLPGTKLGKQHKKSSAPVTKHKAIDSKPKVKHKR